MSASGNGVLRIHLRFSDGTPDKEMKFCSQVCETIFAATVKEDQRWPGRCRAFYRGREIGNTKTPQSLGEVLDIDEAHREKYLVQVLKLPASRMLETREKRKACNLPRSSG